MKASYRSPRIRACRLPMYMGSPSRLSRLVPTSSMTGITRVGSIPPAAFRSEGVVPLPAYSGVPVADVHGIAKQTFPVGADIEHDRDHARRVDSTRRRVDRQFADRYFDATYAPIADSQDLLGVGCENQVDIARSGAEAGKRLFDRLGMIDREVKTPRAPALVLILLHRPAGLQTIDNGDHFAQVLREQPVEQHLIAIV